MFFLLLSLKFYLPHSYSSRRKFPNENKSLLINVMYLSPFFSHSLSCLQSSRVSQEKWSNKVHVHWWFAAQAARARAPYSNVCSRSFPTHLDSLSRIRHVSRDPARSMACTITTCRLRRCRGWLKAMNSLRQPCSVEICMVQGELK